MFDIKPTITEQQLYSEPKIDPANPASFGEVFDAGVKDAWSVSQFSSEFYRERETFAAHIKKVKDLTGREFDNPATVDVLADPVSRKKFNEAYHEHTRQGGTSGYQDFANHYVRKKFVDDLTALKAEFPDKAAEILPERDFGDMARGMGREARLKLEKLKENTGVAGTVASFAGGMYGGLTDPLNLAMMAVTPNVAAGIGMKGLAIAAAKGGAYNAAAEVAMQPFIRADAASVGLPMSTMDSLVSVGAAFGLGAGLDLSVRGAFRGVQSYRGMVPILKNDHVVGWKRPGDVDPVEVAVPGTLLEPTQLDIPDDLTARAFGDGPDAVAARAEIAKRLDSAPDHLSMETVRKAETGDVTDPATIAAQRRVAEVTGEIERPDVRARIDAEETANATIRNRPSDLVDDDTHIAAVKQSVAYVNDPHNNLLPARVLESAPATGWLNDLRAKVDELQARVQQELTDDDRKALLMVNTFDRANADPIAAARMLREDPQLVTRDLDFGETGLGQARSIATLSDEAFERVASGEYAPEIGALVADHVPAGQQIRALEDLTKLEPTSEAEARAMLADMLNGPEYRAPSPDAESPAMLRERQMDDPYGKEAQAQVAQLENELAEELGRKAAPDPTPAEIITDAIKKADEVRSAVESMAGMLPDGVRVKTYTALPDVPDAVVADMLAANRQRFERASLAYQVADNAEARALARLELDEALALRGVEAFVDTADANTIWLASYAMNPRGRIAHEAVHILKAQGRIAPDELTALAQFSRESRAFSPARQASYAEAYKARGTPERIAELLDEEAVAHLIEARANGKIDPVDIPPRILTILDRIAEFFDSIRNALTGKGFTSTAETTFAAQKQRVADIERLIQTIMNGEAAKRVATQAQMKAEDITAMAVRPGRPEPRSASPAPVEPAPAIRAPDQIYAVIDQGVAVAREAGVDLDPAMVRGAVDQVMGTPDAQPQAKATPAATSEAVKSIPGSHFPRDTMFAIREDAETGKRYIEAYHGSPHDFDRFSLDKIGTGEGAQAYGHGLYFADSEGVAKTYRDVLTRRIRKGAESLEAAKSAIGDAVGAKGPLSLEEFNTPSGKRYQVFEETKPKGLLSKAERRSVGFVDELKNMMSDAVQYYPHSDLPGALAKLENTGKMYQVRINADPEHFLDWDKPLSQQSERVRGILEQAASPQGLRHAGSADAQILGGSGQRPAILDQGNGSLNRPSSGVVQQRMGSMVDNGQVLDPVVGLVPVDMVNVLGGKQGPSQVLGHDAPMLFDKLPVVGGDNVSFGVNGTLASKGSIASTATESLGVRGNVSGGAVKGFPTLSADQLRHMTGSQLLDSFASRDAATEALKNQGVAGIKYLDQGSRAAGEGSRNYVVFDDSLIQITHKDGKPVEAAERAGLVNGMKPQERDAAAGTQNSETMFALRDGKVEEIAPETITKPMDNRAGKGLGGSGFSTLADGTNVYVKRHRSDPAPVAREVLGSEIARAIDPSMPKTRMVKVGDRYAVAVDAIEEASPGTLDHAKAFSDGQVRNTEWLDENFSDLTPENQKVLMRQAAIDLYLLNGDAHGAQFIIDKQGKAIGIDKEYSFDSYAAMEIGKGMPADEVRLNFVGSPDGFVGKMVEIAKASRKGDGALADVWNDTVRTILALRSRDVETLIENATRTGRLDAGEIASIRAALQGGRGLFGQKRSMPMFAFAGERARTADLEALARAKAMTEEGKDRTEIWTSTGWFRGVDGKWRFEIDDSGAKFSRGGAPDRASLVDLLDNPNVYNAYPDMEGIYASLTRGGEGGTHDPGNPLETVRIRGAGSTDALGTGLHETQHAVQIREAMARGGSPSMFSPREVSAERWQMLDKYGDVVPENDAAFLLYHRLAGETEARTVQKRMNLTAEERRARPPWLDYDVPEDQQIVRFGQGQQNSEPMFALADRDTGKSMRRDLDALGYYSAALEGARGLRQAKGTPEQMLAQLRSAGVKQAEIDATNLAQFLDGKKSVTRDEIASYLETNRVGVREQRYIHDKEKVKIHDDWLAAHPNEDMPYEELKALRKLPVPKWMNNSLDPSNPTYRETVIHLPSNIEAGKFSPGDELARLRNEVFEAQMRGDDETARRLGIRAEDLEIQYDTSALNPIKTEDFRSGHFPEPNIIGHMMTSMTKHEGRPVYTIDQIQSDWGQKLRDGGVRDEAKIAELKKQADDAHAKLKAIQEQEAGSDLEAKIQAAISRYDAESKKASGNPDAFGSSYEGSELKRAADEMTSLMGERKSVPLMNEWQRLKAELKTAEEATSSGHPLVNTTDQWTTTTLRRAIRQAAEADAEYIAIPSGDTVLSYNPGDTHGMHSFYGRTSERQALAIGDDLEPLPSTTSRAPVEGIVPKNLRKLLEKLDKSSAKPQLIETLDTPTSGAKGKGFTLFPLTDKVKSAVREEGQAMFALRDERGREKLGAAERARQLKDDLAEIETRFQASGGDQREKLQAKRAVLLNARAQERILDEIEQFKTFAGFADRRMVADPARAFLMQHEGYASVQDAPFKDLKHLKEVIERDAMGRMADVAIEYRKGAITGDMRRRFMKTSIDNMMKEAAGENTGDALAKKLAQQWLSVAEYLRQRFNAAGGDIGKLEGWIAPQHHDPEMLMTHGREKWVDYLMAKGVLDRERMLDLSTGKQFEDTALRDVLRDIWTTITTAGANKIDPDNPVMGKGAMYKRHMDNRVIHFKNAESWLKYQREMGDGDVVAAMHGHVSRMARDIAAMEMFGANPNLTRERIKATLKQQAAMYRPNTIVMTELGEVMREAWAKVQSTNRGTEFSAAVEDAWKTVRAADKRVKDDGGMLSDLAKSLDELRVKTSNQAVPDDVYAKVESNLAALETIFTHLDGNPATGPLVVKGRELIGEIRNQALFGDMFAKKKDPLSYVNKMLTRSDDVWSSYMGQTNVPVDYVMAQRFAATRNILSSSMLTYAWISSLTDQSTQLGARMFIGMPVTSQLSSYLKAFKGSTKEEMIRAGLGHEMAMASFSEHALSVNRFNAHQVSGYIADRSHQFSFLSPSTAATKTAFSHDFMTWMPTLQKMPYAELPPEVQRMFKRHGVSILDWDLRLRKVEPEMLGGGVPALTRNAIQDAYGVDLADKYVMMLLRERSFSTLESGHRARTAIIGQIKPGNLMGEVVRSGAMLKSFATTYTMLILGRQYAEIMAGRYASAAAYAGAVTIVGSLIGAMAIQFKHLAQGRDPQDMRQPVFWGQAFMQAGGAGIFGDFLKSGSDRNGKGLGEMALGPLVGLAGNIAGLTLGNITQFGRDEKTNAGREAVEIVRKMTPGMFVPWYLRMGYNRMILDEWQKVFDPDANKSFSNQIRNRKKTSGVEFYYPPGQMYPSRAPNLGAAFGQK